MTNIAHTCSAICRIWSHNWCRRITYAIVSGTIIVAIGQWGIQKFIVDRWLIHEIDRYSKTHYGVGLQVTKLAINPLRSRIVLHHISFGNDIFKADLIEIKLRWTSLLLKIPHIRSLRIEGASINIDKNRLRSVQINKYHKEQAVPKFRLDYLEVGNSQVHIQEPSWGLPKCDFSFKVSGKGWETNQLYLELYIPKINIKKRGQSFNGSLSVATNITDKRLKITKGFLNLNNNNLDFNGDFQYSNKKINLNTIGRLDVPQLQLLLPTTKYNTAIASGILRFNSNINGHLDHPSWTTIIHGEQLKVKGLPIDPGNLTANISGNSSEIQLNNILWTSKSGNIQATGTLSKGKPSSISLNGDHIFLYPIAAYTRANFLNNATVCFCGKLIIPPKKTNTGWTVPTLKKLKFNCIGELKKNGNSIGGITLTLDSGHLKNSIINLNLAEVKCYCELSGLLDENQFKCINGKANIVTDANNIGRMLAAWNIGKVNQCGQLTTMNMEGKTELQTSFGWNRPKGILLDGDLIISKPRWHMASADCITAKLSIERDTLRIKNIQLNKNDGRGYGDLWLSWGNIPPGEDQIDMNYKVCQIPIKEGLRAADITNLDIEGNGDGWIRLHGPFKKITAEGQVTTQQSKIWGLNIPVASTSFSLDIAANQFKIKDIRIVDHLEYLAKSNGIPLRPLDLYGSIDIGLDTRTWLVTVQGSIDSKILGLNQPHLQAQIETKLHGPFTTTLGTMQVPTGIITLKNGCIINGAQTLKGIDGTMSFDNGEIEAQLGISDANVSLLKLHANQNSTGQITGTMGIHIGSQSADTVKLATSLTNGFLQDAQLELSSQVKWDKDGFHCAGNVNELNAYFNGVNLVQSYPGQFVSDSHGVDINLMLTSVISKNINKPEMLNLTVDDNVQRDKPIITLTSDTPNVSLQGRLPFSFNDPSLSLTVIGTSNLTNLKYILDQILQPDQYGIFANLHSEGTSIFNLHLGGTINKTTINGSLNINNGQMLVRNQATSIDNLNVAIQFDGRDIIIPRTAPLLGTMSHGALTTWGKITWNPGNIFYYDLHTSLAKFQIRDTSGCYEIQGNLTTDLKGDSHNGGILSGMITVDKSIYHNELSVVDLMSNNIIDSTSNTPALTTYDYLTKVDLNLDIQLLTPLKFDTNFLKTQWQSKNPLLIKGSLSQPMLKGRIELLPGSRLTNLFPAGDMILERGIVDFTDKMPFDPNINIKGTITTANHSVALNVFGNTSNIQANLSSTPPLRQDQILIALTNPYVIDGTLSNPTQPAQVMQVTVGNSLITNLLTSLALYSPQEKMCKILNLDRVNVSFQTLAPNPDFIITVAKNIDLLGYHFPILLTHSRANNIAKSSGRVEWQFGNLILRLGATNDTGKRDKNNQTTNKSWMVPSGEIYYTWSPN